MKTQEIIFAELRYNDMQKIYYCFILMCLCFQSYAQKHAVIKFKDCEVVIYGAYGDRKEGMLARKIVNDTVFVAVITAYDEEIQGKVIKLKSVIADSFIVEQCFKTILQHTTEENITFEYKPYEYLSDWKVYDNIKKSKYRIMTYSEKAVPYKIDMLPLKTMKLLLKEFLKKKYKRLNFSNPYNYSVRDAKKVSDFMRTQLCQIYLRITLYKHSQKVGERLIVFEYVYGC